MTVTRIAGLIRSLLGCLLVSFAVFSSACGSEPTDSDDSDGEAGAGTNVCSLGQTQVCVGPGACQGGQRCLPDGSGWGVCDCGTPNGGTSGGGGTTGVGGTTGSGGTAGTAAVGGTSGIGGTSGSGGSTPVGGTTGTGGSSGASGNGNTISLTVVYGGSLTRTLSNCYSCTATYIATNDTAQAMFQVEDGYTIFGLQFQPNTSASGYRVLLILQETNMQIPAMYYGQYYDSMMGAIWLPTADSCISFSALEMRFGGRVAGTVNCMLQGGNAMTPITAMVTGSFSATFPQ